MQPTRRKLSHYVADQLMAGQGAAALENLAAELVYSKRVRELDLIVRDIEQALTGRGVAVADVASAHPLASASRDELTAYIKRQTDAKIVELREQVDPALLGGFHVRVSGRELDATLSQKITQLRAQKI